MGKVKEIIPLKERCDFCHIRKATKLCDFPIYTGRFAGHPPKINGQYIKVSDYTTCSRKMCEKCATHIDDEIDFCPHCTGKIKNVIGK